MAISNDLRRRIVDAYEAGEGTYAEIAERFSVGSATVNRLLRRHREDNTVEPRPHGGGRRRVLSEKDEKRLEGMVLANPDWAEHEYASALAQELGRELNRLVVGRSIRRMGYRVKKSPSSPASETNQPIESDESDTSKESTDSMPRIWFLWTKPDSTRR
jgi:transposase